MSVAFNINGEPFEIPAGAAYWRPRRVRDRGLEVVYQPQGCVPLMMPITITAEEFQREVGGQPGKYRLDALDEEYQPIERMPPAYLVIARPESAAPASSPLPATGAVASQSIGGGANDNQTSRPSSEISEMAALLREVVKVNAEVSKTLAERYAAVLESAAHLVRAADGAGMPARTPAETPRNSGPASGDPGADEDDEDDGDIQDPDELSAWSAFAREWAPSVLRWFGFESANNPTSAAPRNAKPNATPEPEARTKAAPWEKEAEAPPSIDQPKMTPAIMIRLSAIKNRLTNDEAAFLKEVYGELSSTEVVTWMTELAAMPVDDAVALLREKIAASANADQEVAS